jgi:hypothetical protein
VQPREWKVSFAFEPCDREHLVAAAAGVAGRDVQEGRLADAGCTRDEESAAAIRDLGKGIVQPSQLSISADQPGRAAPRLILSVGHV